MKYLKTYKLFESEEQVSDALELLELWGMKGSSWDEVDKRLIVKFEYPDRVNQDEINTLNRVIRELKVLILDFSGNDLKDCINYFKLEEGIERLNFYDNNITKLPEIPKSVIAFGCSNNLLTELPKLPKNLEMLICTQNNLIKLPDLPDSLNYLDCSYNNLEFLPKLPYSIKHLNCSKNYLLELPELPENMENLECFDNSLKFLPKLPKNLNYLDCSYNLMEILPELPETLTHLNSFQTYVPYKNLEEYKKWKERKSK